MEIIKEIKSENEEFNIQVEKEEMIKKIQNSQEIDNIMNAIVVYEPETIVKFGDKAVVEIAKCSDIILNSMNISQINETGQMLKALNKIMDQFNIDEIVEKEGFFCRIFGNLKKHIENILNKYHTLGDEIDKIYIQLKKYEADIYSSNKTLEKLFQANMNYYHELIKYILAGEEALKEIDEYIKQKEQEIAKSQDKMIQFDIDALIQARSILEQRIHDLRIAENIALQSIPMLKTIQFSNINLIRKINSAFIITLPIFKQALSQALLLKRQKIQAEAIGALDKKTNEMLIKNAKNTAEQSKLTAQFAYGSSIKIETLRETWKTIMNGIKETQRIQDEVSKKREYDRKQLEIIKESFDASYNISVDQ